MNKHLGFRRNIMLILGLCALRFTGRHLPVSHWSHVRFGLQDIGNDVDDVSTDVRRDDADFNNFVELVNHRIQIGGGELLVAA